MAESIDQLPVRVLAVIVLYKLKPSESVTFKTLQAAVSYLKNGQANIKTLLYDNTPGGQDAGVLPADVQYIADLENGGLAKAYNYALEIAHEQGFDWLLTLDQDTGLPIDFMYKLCHTAAFVTPLNNIAAIVPCVTSDGRVISPGIITKHWPVMKRFAEGFIGISLEKLTSAVNSASMVKVSALRAIGGYDLRFWLDYSDFAMYHRLQANNLRVFVAGNIYVEHELSVYDLKNRATPSRYEDILRAEEAFCDECMGRSEGIVLLLKILLRLFYKLRKTGASLPYYKIATRFFCRRLFYSRKHRMETWERLVKTRIASPD